ncbi:Eco57I restriction-modification methylase domain-containing protein [Synechocystis sp. PCC 7338]|uniref:Eco57I restriction-modification methylase domain-containing protein n=1 Tax=Synechocystis sp. PCC 7338 TaxID=2732530 RepID=UPI001BAEDBAB|nr:DNA methyltransferase [Synechocystis sp. PCC 7338]QUS62573.1 ATP-binding protein [Synechocystis sp. PCC 7338]
MKLNRTRTRKYLQKFDFESLFIEELGWDTIDRIALPLEIDEDIFEAIAIAQKRGFMVYYCSTPEIPERKVRLALDRQLSDYSKSHLLIFGDEAQTSQVWMWVKQEGKKRKPIFHSYNTSKSAEPLIQKLEPLFFSIDEEDDATLVKAVEKVSQGFNIEQVTKQFFQDFEGLHKDFCLEIDGIENEGDRRWYGSVVLNRLMFVYFLQRRYFLDNKDSLYLQHKLEYCQANAESFYEFLKDLFFEGFAKPEYERGSDLQKRLGKICYLNGGLFLRHSLEQKYSEISIKDKAFGDAFELFSRYSWHLNDRPDAEKDSNEINPDVLGYIFEKYINQKEFGAYYTRPEITEYLCDRTINKLVLDKVNSLANKDFKNLPQLFAGLNTDLCLLLLNEILPKLTLLDPACGSGAFLVAAMKTLIPIYQTITGKIAFSNDEGLKAWLAEIQQDHASLDYYIKKRIITDNLYGVDIMEEATEIAKLRLFLALVAAVDKVEDLEPLPNVDFNIMAGNSLIGLIRVDEHQFNSKKTNKYNDQLATQGELGLFSSDYQNILTEKNKSIALYKQHAFISDKERNTEESEQVPSILLLRSSIDELNQKSQKKLNEILLNEFNSLKIKYEEAQLNGKAKKRVLNIDDINALEPFHWGYHFDKVFERGGFDAIIANPPWEIFKPQAKEFFAHHSDLVTKNKMDIKSFEKEQKKLLEKPEVAEAWLEYQSKFPYVSAYYRSAEDYRNQISVVNGKKAGTDINLYKLFLERCYHLLQNSGRCGIIIPSGIYTDLGTKQLREMLFSQTKIDTLFGLSNEKFIFESVHHAFKFALISFEKGKPTEKFNAVFRINPREAIKSNELEDFLYDQEQQVTLSAELVRKLSPDSLSVMEFKQPIDITIAEKMTRFPLLGEKITDKWNLKLCNEFHMTNDSHLFKTEPLKGRLPLYEGKMIHQFTYQWGEPKYWLDENEAKDNLLSGRIKSIQKLIKKSGLSIVINPEQVLLDYSTYRLAFRDVAASTNERTVIMTVLPPNKFCPHTMSLEQVYEAKIKNNSIDFNFSTLNNNERLFLCAVMNSFVVDASLRQSITSHVSFFFVYNTPVPRLQKGDQWFSEIVQRAAKLICTTSEFDELAAEVGLNKKVPLTKGDSGGCYGVTDEAERAKLRAELDGIIAHLYGLTEIEFKHILSTFPIVADDVKQNALNAYRDVKKGVIQ